jgi:ribosome recycling factor
MPSPREMCLRVLADHFPLESDLGAQLLVRVVREMGYENALTIDALRRLANDHIEQDRREMRAASDRANNFGYW